MTLTGTLTLSGTTSSVFIFQAASTLVAGTTSSVVLTGGVQACNVYWQVGSSATLKTGAKFDGTVMAHTSASLTKTVTVSGRVLAETGAVTLLSDHVVVPTCNAPPVTTTTVPATTKTTTSLPAPLPAATSHPAPFPATATAATVPATHTGEPWAGWLYWVLVTILGAVGIGLVADRARRHRLGHRDNG